MEEDRGAVLRAEVRALAVHLRRVVHLPESVKQLLIGQRRWIESNLHDFGMPGFIGADVFIRGIFSVAAAVPDDGVNNSGNAAECCFYPPKASCSKGCGFGHGTAPLKTHSTRIAHAIRCRDLAPRFLRAGFDGVCAFARARKVWR